MITVTTVKKYTTTDGTAFESLDAAKAHELNQMLTGFSPGEIAAALVLNAGLVIEILSLKERKKRTPKQPKPEATPAA